MSLFWLGDVFLLFWTKDTNVTFRIETNIVSPYGEVYHKITIFILVVPYQVDYLSLCHKHNKS